MTTARQSDFGLPSRWLSATGRFTCSSSCSTVRPCFLPSRALHSAADHLADVFLGPSGNLLSQSFTYVFPSIVSTLGYNKTITSLLTAPPWLAAFLSCLVVTFHASKTGQRAYYVAGCMGIAAIGHILLFATTATAGRYLGMVRPFTLLRNTETSLS
jgi:hypothetical protein